MKYADLHVHTSYSDSTFSPEEVIGRAVGAGLSAIAICDHDTIDGIAPCMESGKAAGVEVIPGIEMTIEKTDAEIHILGYFIDWQDAWFRGILKEIQASRVERVYKMIEKLKDFGIDVDPEDVFKLSGKGSVGRMHLAHIILKTGKVSRSKEVFDKYIGFGKPCYIPNVRLSPEDTIAAIRKVGGVPVLAHPHITSRDEYIGELVSYGLRGIEAYHSDHSNSVSKRYEEIAGKNGLLVTGGSDCHGLNKSKVLMGTMKVPYGLVEKLKAESEKIRDEER